MIYIHDQYATVWEVEDKGKYSLVKMSTSRKDKESGEYKNSNWSFVRFVADAHKMADQLERGTKIIIKGGGISQEPYINADGEKAWPKNPQIVVFNFEFPEDSDTPSRSTRMDQPPSRQEVEENDDDSDEMPF